MANAFDKFDVADNSNPFDKFDNEPAKEAKKTTEPTLLQQAGAVANDLPRQLGLAARYGLQGLASIPGIVADPLNYLTNKALGTNLQTMRGATEQNLNAAGLPQPQTPTERNVAQASELLAGTGGMIGGAAGLAKQLPKLAPALSALTSRPGLQASSAIGSGLAGGEAQEKGYSPAVQGAASLIGGLGLPIGVAAINKGIDKTISGAKALGSWINPAYTPAPAKPAITSPITSPKEMQDSVRNSTLKAGQEAGYIIPPSTTNPSFMNRNLESIAGKAAVQQAASTANQEVTNTLARRALPGFGENTPLTSSEINAYRATQADIGYKPVASLGGKFDVNSSIDLPNVKTSPTIISSTGQQVIHKTISPYEAVSTLRELRSKASDAWNAYTRGDGASLAPAKELTKQAAEMEKVIEDNLEQRNLPDLMNDFRNSRTNIAKSHTVGNAIVEGSGNINAQKIAQQFEKDAPLTDELATIGAFANTFPKATANPKTIGSQGVSKMKFGLSSILGGIGGSAVGAPGIAAAAIPFVAPGAAEKLLLSSPYQRLMTLPSYNKPQYGRFAAPGLISLQSGLLAPKQPSNNN